MAADYIYSEGKRLESLSYKLLGLFQIQKGELMMAPVSMVALGEAVKRVTEQNLKNKNMQLDVSMEPGEVTGAADLFQFDRQRQESIRGRTAHPDDRENDGTWLSDCHRRPRKRDRQG